MADVALRFQRPTEASTTTYATVRISRRTQEESFPTSRLQGRNETTDVWTLNVFFGLVHFKAGTHCFVVCTCTPKTEILSMNERGRASPLPRPGHYSRGLTPNTDPSVRRPEHNSRMNHTEEYASTCQSYVQAGQDQHTTAHNAVPCHFRTFC